jgi:hypothetical protein
MRVVRKIKSFERFSNELLAGSPELVVVQADRRPVRFGTSLTAAVGRLGTYHHGLIYTVGDAEKQSLYREPLFTASQSEYGFGDADERNKRMLEVLLAGAIRVGQLSLTLADTEVYLGDADLQPMPQEKLEAMFVQARDFGVTPPEFTV